jgi:glycosyltransferase involved in cell wall biosynthesis
MTRFKSDFYHTFLYKNIDTIIAVTNMVKEQLEKFIPNNICPKLHLCYIGANTPKLLSDEEKEILKRSLGLKDEFIVAIVGRIEEAKGQHIVLEAVEKLRRNNIKAKTLVIGHAMNNEYANNLKKNYPNDIFTGFINNPSDCMQIADCVVLATKKETFGLVLIEAMQCGICVLGSNQGGPLEIIEHEKSGLLFESMNSNDLYEKLIDLYQHPNKKERLSQLGKQKAISAFDAQTQFQKFKTILENI